jgi:hypothetical protein
MRVQEAEGQNTGKFLPPAFTTASRLEMHHLQQEAANSYEQITMQTRH